jgi:hypothetical protein
MISAEQKQQLMDLVSAVQRVVREAQGVFMTYEVAEAIARADDAQSKCYQFVESLPAESESDTVA